MAVLQTADRISPHPTPLSEMRRECSAVHLRGTRSIFDHTALAIGGSAQLQLVKKK